MTNNLRRLVVSSFFQIILLWWAVCGFIGAMIGAPKDRMLLGFFLGLFLGPLGCLIVLCLRNSEMEGRPLLTAVGLLAFVILLTVSGVALFYLRQSEELEDPRSGTPSARRPITLQDMLPAAFPTLFLAPTPTPLPVVRGTPRVSRLPYVSRAPTPSPADVNADILRKYGGRP